MFRIDTPGATTTLPAFGTWDGVARYFQDSDPAGGTEVSAEWLNHIQEELCYLIETQGLTLDKQDTTLLYKAVTRALVSGDSAGGGVSAVTGHDAAVLAANGQASGSGALVAASGGGSTATGDGSAVVASTTSNATGLRSAVIAANSSDASGQESAVIGGASNTASGVGAATVGASNANATGANAVAVGSDGAIASGDRAVALGKNCELATADAIGGGNGASKPAASGTDQNLTWRIKHADGEIWTQGQVRAEGGLAVKSPWVQTQVVLSATISAGSYADIELPAVVASGTLLFGSFVVQAVTSGNATDLVLGQVYRDGTTGKPHVVIRNVGGTAFSGDFDVRVLAVEVL